MRVGLLDLLAAGQDADIHACDPQYIGESIRLELERLLNTRRTERAYTGAPSIVDYGIGDWSALYADREEDQRVIIRDVRNAIVHFEPRLQLESIEVQPVPGQRSRMTIRMLGHIRGISGPSMAFVMNLGDGDFEVKHDRFD